MNITSFQIGPDPEKDIICVEDLLMQIALVGVVFEQINSYIEEVEANDGVRPDNVLPPDHWAVAGVYQSLNKVSHALKAGCWGHEAAHIH